MTRSRRPPLETPDGRYIVVRGRLWRRSDPGLDENVRQRLVNDLMTARRAVAKARRDHGRTAESTAHEAVDRCKHALGERGPVWWHNGAPGETRRLARNTRYANWFAGQDVVDALELEPRTR